MGKPVDNYLVEKISKILGEEMRGSDITMMFNILGMTDFDSKLNRPYTSTKWKRLVESIIDQCKKDNSAKSLFKSIEYVMKPSRFIDTPTEWTGLKHQLNSHLMFYGFEVSDSGKITETEIVETFSEAQKRLKTLHDKLSDIEIHEQVFKYCSEELLAENYFHSILEASKGLMDRIRSMTDSDLDGSALINNIFKFDNPRLIIGNSKLETSNEKNQYNGLINLLKSIIFLYRNPKAHEPKLYNPASVDDAVVAFVQISLAHRILDDCVRVG